MRWRAWADRALRVGLERLHAQRPVLVPEYPLDLRARWGWGDAPALSAVGARLAADSAHYEQTIQDACELLDWAHGIPRQDQGPGQPCWENDWWGTVDALVQVERLDEAAELLDRSPPDSVGRRPPSGARLSPRGSRRHARAGFLLL